MTLQYGFYNSVSSDRLYDAIDMSRIFDGMILDGVYAAIGDKLMVSEDTGLNMKVSVGTGRAWFDHTWTYNDAAVLLDIAAADALLDRIDVVYLEINAGSGVRANSLAVLTGTPASEPVPPTLTQTADIHQYPLAHIEVAAGVTAITDANVENQVGLTATPFVTCPLEYVTTNEMLAQWEAEWEEWFDAIKDQLTTEAETNLQAQIWAIVGDINPPLMDLIDLDTHDHTDYGDPIPEAGIDALAVTSGKIGTGAVIESKIGALAVTSGKLGAESVIASKLGNDIAGDGLTGGAGSELAVNLHYPYTLDFVDGELCVKDNSIGRDQLDYQARCIYIPATRFESVTGAAKVYDQEEGIRLAYLTGTEQVAVTAFGLPHNRSELISVINVYAVFVAASSGIVDWYGILTELEEGRLSTGSNDLVLTGAQAGDGNNIKYGLMGQYTPSEDAPCLVNITMKRITGSLDTNPGTAYLYGLLFRYTAYGP